MLLLAFTGCGAVVVVVLRRIHGLRVGLDVLLWERLKPLAVKGRCGNSVMDWRACFQMGGAGIRNGVGVSGLPTPGARLEERREAQCLLAAFKIGWLSLTVFTMHPPQCLFIKENRGGCRRRCSAEGRPHHARKAVPTNSRLGTGVSFAAFKIGS